MLDQEESFAETACGSCGAIILDDDDPRSFAFSSTGEICWDCAMARGGRWDAETEQWTVPPHVEDLLPPYPD